MLPAQGIGQSLGEQQLTDVVLSGPPGNADAGDGQDAAPGVLTDIVGEAGAAQAAEKPPGVQALHGHEPQHRGLSGPLEGEDHIPLPLHPAQQLSGEEVPAAGEVLAQVIGQPLVHAGLDLERQVFRLEDGLVLRLAQVEVVVIDILLGHRVHQIGDVPVQVHRLPDTGGGDVLQMGGQGELHHPGGDGGVVGAAAGTPVGGAAEDNMGEGVDGVGLGCGAVGGGVGHHIAAHHDIDLPAGETLDRVLAEIFGVGDIHRKILRKMWT